MFWQLPLGLLVVVVNQDTSISLAMMSISLVGTFLCGLFDFSPVFSCERPLRKIHERAMVAMSIVAAIAFPYLLTSLIPEPSNKLGLAAYVLAALTVLPLVGMSASIYLSLFAKGFLRPRLFPRRVQMALQNEYDQKAQLDIQLKSVSGATLNGKPIIELRKQIESELAHLALLLKKTGK